MALVDRAQAILMRPRQEWEVINTEQATVSGLYQSYVGPLAAIGPIAGVIGATVFGVTVPVLGTVVRSSITSLVANAVVSWVLALVGVYILAWIVDYLAPTFGGTKDRMQAFKLAAYSGTATWLAGIFQLIPALSILSILGRYSAYLLYTGIPPLMKVPQERALGYIVGIVIAYIVIAIVVGIVAGALVAAVAF